MGGCLPSFDSDVRHFSVVLTTAFVIVRSSQNRITLRGSHYYQATVGLNVAVNGGRTDCKTAGLALEDHPEAELHLAI